MAEAIELKAWARQSTGKGGARQVRRDGRLPGIVYGADEAPQTIALESKAISKQIQTGHFQSTVFMLDLDGTKTRVIPRDVQLDPVRDFPIHVDFMRLSRMALVSVDVPVHFLNELISPGLKRGGVLNVVRHDIPVRCPADKIPNAFEIDLKGLEIGDSIHISSIPMPDGVRPPLPDRDFTIATIVGRTAEEATGEEEGEAEAAEAGAAKPAAKAEGASADKEKPKEEKKK
ncbi:50S ribosomal protein L25/general stress protein Ctc [Methyloceanibacter superfactus]|uniref:Large ribosomal subunit protein bL25 n=1 Tax=Methyloceanibacter superfactus TaxID=1774969 RepID=A0A1E3W7H8_9HYPH|nr:50S ribosomal protein L25/general stress protein Ctc [Methyloceanibacter superfactus]ODS01462.1 50S ribosomal protein L25/general stress protein Ctc [Methyloceanibacter superfactus]